MICKIMITIGPNLATLGIQSKVWPNLANSSPDIIHKLKKLCMQRTSDEMFWRLF